MVPEDAILLIEDNEDDSYLMQHHLKRRGVCSRIESLADPHQAKRYLEQCRSGSSPRIIIVALSLRAGRGHDVLRWVREQPHLQDTVVVAVGNSDQEKDVQRAYDLGANAYYSKSIDFGRFPELIHSLEFLDPETPCRE